MHDEDFDIYLKEISQYKQFTKDELIDYFKRYQNGEDLLNEIFIHNTALVIFVAKKFFKYLYDTSFTVMDLVQYGNLGLIKAIKTYDLGSNFAFSTWAYVIIYRTIWSAIRDYGKYFIVNDWTNKKMIRYANAIEKLEKELQRNPTIEEIASELKMSSDKVLRMQKYLIFLDIQSLDNLYDTSYEDNIMFLADENYDNSVEEDVMDKICREKIIEIIKKVKLTDNERKVLLYRFNNYNIKTLGEISLSLGLCKQRICQIEQSAIRKIKKSNEFYELALYRNNGKTEEQIKMYIKNINI